MNILVTGGNGQLGNELRLAACHSERSFCHSELPLCHSERSEESRSFGKPQDDKPCFLFTDVNEASEESVAMLRKLGGEGVDTSTTKLDITDLEAIRAIVREHKIDAIINCAAWTNVDGAEDPEKYALVEKLNATAPENLAKAMKEVDGWLVQISTDYVFGKEPYNTPCKEDQQGTPTGVYGATKLLGEQKIIATGCKYMILRTAWLYSEFGKNFVRTMLNLTATKPQLKVVFDQTGTPTYAWDLANAILAALMNPVVGVFHYSNEGVCSWFDFTKTIAEMAGQTKCEILPCHSNEFPSPVKRPSYSVLDKTKIKETFGLTIPYWTDSLRRCLSALL